MSGIFGLHNLTNRPVLENEMAQMAHLLTRRGPDETGIWKNGSTGLGHTSLATTPEALHEKIPVSHPPSSCTITADVRLDNRTELLSSLNIDREPATVGDANLILAAYLAWGTDCVDHLLGDYAFAIWDPRKQRLFCARDHLGVRPFYYYYKDGHFFAFASEPRAILVLPQVPYIINEARIADSLITQLEAIDKTSTFFKDVYRLPPAHVLTVTEKGIRIRRYWKLEAGPVLQLSSDNEYVEAFLEVFDKAVSCRLRGTDTVGSMLSGGMDSGSVVAVARKMLSQSGQGPLRTFSAVSPEATACVETQAINAALSMGGLEPHMVNFGDLTELLPQLSELAYTVDEPFDSIMTIIHAVYLSAHRQGVKALLDGIDGDTVLSEGRYIAYLLRQGKWPTAFREAVAQNRFWEGAYPAWLELFRGSRQAFTPDTVKTGYHGIVNSPARQQSRNIRASIISPDFARRINLADRLETLSRNKPSVPLSNLNEDLALVIDRPSLTVGIERYNRVASSVAIEPRHPFLDIRVVRFCLGLPANQKLDHGWPKMILRRAMAGKLPDPVRWRLGKQHLGWSFTKALMEATMDQMKAHIVANENLLENYLDMDKLSECFRSYFDEKNPKSVEYIKDAAWLAVWLHHNSERGYDEENT